MMQELLVYLERVSKDPTLLLRDDEVLSTELYQQWDKYNTLIYARGRGMTAGGKRTAGTY